MELPEKRKKNGWISSSFSFRSENNLPCLVWIPEKRLWDFPTCDGLFIHVYRTRKAVKFIKVKWWGLHQNREAANRTWMLGWAVKMIWLNPSGKHQLVSNIWHLHWKTSKPCTSNIIRKIILANVNVSFWLGFQKTITDNIFWENLIERMGVGSILSN